MIENEITGTGKVVVAGHRGALGYAPENTLASFRKAGELHLDATECDVHLSADGEVVVIHDPFVDRVSNGVGPVSSFTLAQLKALDFGSKFSSKFAGEQIPTLVEVLETTIALGMDLIIEIKGDPEPSHLLVEKTVAIVKERHLENKVNFISFYHPCLPWVREIDDSLATGILFGHDTPDPIASAKQYGANSIRPHFSRVTRELVEAAHANDLCVHTWVIDDPDQAREIIDLGVDAIAGDYPDILQKVVTELGKQARI